MNNKQDIRAKRDELVMSVLKDKYEFFYKQLLSEAKPKLVEHAKVCCQDELNDHAQDGIHTEQIDRHHSGTSVAVDFEQVSEIIQEHKALLELIDAVYSED